MRRAAITRGAAPVRKTRLRHRSPKMAKVYREERAPMVAEILADRQVCEVCSAARSTDVHEPKTRGRGGSITNPANAFALCRTCHDAIYPGSPLALARPELLLNSWDEEPVQ